MQNILLEAVCHDEIPAGPANFLWVEEDVEEERIW
jgi:hypothetical protein